MPVATARRAPRPGWRAAGRTGRGRPPCAGRRPRRRRPGSQTRGPTARPSRPVTPLFRARGYNDARLGGLRRAVGRRTAREVWYDDSMQLPSVPAGLYVKPWPPVLATRGPGSLRALHSHHAMHFVLASGGDLRIRTSPRGRWETAAGALTSPDAPHAIDARRVEMLVIFFDPESDVGATLRSALRVPVRPLSRAERDELVRGVEDPQSVVHAGMDEWVRRAATTLGLTPGASRRVMHPGVRKLLARLRTSGLDDDTSLEALASTVGLSPGRLMHAFTESTGIALRPYLAWLRVQRAACAIVEGASLTEAALIAGFSDAPHMGRTFRRRLGITPSALRPMRCRQAEG